MWRSWLSCCLLAEGDGWEAVNAAPALHARSSIPSLPSPTCPPTCADKAADAVKQTVMTAGAVGVCYGLLRMLYPAVEMAAP